MVRHDEQELWSSEICEERHRSVTRYEQATLGLLTLILLVVGWFISNQWAIASKADTAVRSVEITSVKSDQFKDNVKEDLSGIKIWLGKISDKQDKLNDSVQRLLQDNENPKNR